MTALLEVDLVICHPPRPLEPLTKPILGGADGCRPIYWNNLTQPNLRRGSDGHVAGLVNMWLVWRTCGWSGGHVDGLEDMQLVWWKAGWSGGHVVGLVDIWLIS